MTGAGGAAADVTWTSVDGVPVVHAHEPGPLKASLMFRVGKTDETLPTNGITHMVEHLTLFPLGQKPHYQNGSVRTSITTFDVSGEPGEVTRFLAGVCAGLSSLPVERLATEIRVLDTEAGHKNHGLASALLTWRFGPGGPGLWAFDEFATTTVDAERLQGWAHERFTRGNAVLLLSAAPPQDLRLPLRDGPGWPVPPLADVIPATPAWFRHGFSDISALAPVRRSVAAVAYTYCLQSALVERLRFDRGIAYSPSVDYDPYDAETALLWISGDSHPEHVAEVTQEIEGSITTLAEEGPAVDRLEEYRATSLASWDNPDATLPRAYSQAFEHLLTGRVTPLEDHRTELEQLTAADVQAVAREVRSALLYAVPQGGDLTEEQAVPAPEMSQGDPVSGTTHLLIGGGLTSERFVVSPEGVSAIRPGAGHATVHFSTCRAVLAWPDGRRVLVAPDGITVTVEPTLWDRGASIVSAIDAATADRFVPRPERAPADIPKPPLTGPGRLWAKAPGERRSRASWIVMVCAGILLLFAASSFASTSAHSGSTGATVSRLVFIASGVALGLWGFRRG